MTMTNDVITSGASQRSSTSRERTAAPRPVRSLCAAGAVAGVVAAAATFGVASLADALDVSLRISGEAIPRYAFIQLTLMATVIGLVIAVIAARRAIRPRHTFFRVTLALTALSFVPDLLVDAQAATKITLMLSHVAAAAIVIPALASRLADAEA